MDSTIQLALASVMSRFPQLILVRIPKPCGLHSPRTRVDEACNAKPYPVNSQVVYREGYKIEQSLSGLCTFRQLTASAKLPVTTFTSTIAKSLLHSKLCWRAVKTGKTILRRLAKMIILISILIFLNCFYVVPVWSKWPTALTDF